MVTHIDWSPSTQALQRWYTRLGPGESGWPPPRPDTPASDDDHRRLARKHWCERIRATYVTTSAATANFQELIALGAPLDVLTGASYVADELTHHLGMLVHLIDPFAPPTTPSVPDDRLRTGDAGHSWQRTFEDNLRLYAFNLTLSEPTYRAIAAVSSDSAVSRLSTMLADNLEELTGFGRETLRWMADRAGPAALEAVRERIPDLLGGYESLCHGDPELLEGVAGQELAVETDPGNLGSLRDDQLAFLFYDTLTSSILPLLDDLGWDGHELWQQHYHADQSRPVTVAAVGLSRA